MAWSLRVRLMAVIIVMATVVTGLVWRSRWFLGPPLVAQHGGTALWSVALYFGIRCLAPRLPVLMIGGAAMVIAMGVEFLQLTPLPRKLAEVHPGFRLVLGASFDPVDLLWLGAGVLVASGTDRVIRDRLDPVFTRH